jgi:single-stranded DNA-binding protein
VDKNDGQKRSKLKIVLDNLQFLEPRSDGANAEPGSRPATRQSGPSAPAQRRSAAVAAPPPSYDDEPEPMDESPDAEGSGNIPF